VLAEFLRAYGMRGAVELDLGRPRWRDDPTPILQTLQGYLRLEDQEQAPDVVYRRGREEAERLADAYVDRVRRTRLGWLRARVLRATIRRMRILGGLRETPLFYLVSISDVYRRALLDCAASLVAHGQLENAQDIFFAPLQSLWRFAEGEQVALRQIVSANRIAYERESTRRQMPRVLLRTGEAYYEGMPETGANEGELRGEAVSPGTSEGRVRVILDPHGASLDPGEILVCPSTDPGWTPLFRTAGGLVMEIGGLITHGSVVAREFGIPAVVGVQQATTRWKAGDCGRGDGNTGRSGVLKG
jgi:pyruvate,water dikinase